MKKYIFITVLCIVAMLLSACSSEKIYESEKMNAYERTEYTLPREYSDTDIHIIDS